MVTNTGDNGGVDPTPGAGTGTLRQAIVDANQQSLFPSTIDFNIPTTDPNFANGVFTIKPQSQLPSIEDVTTVDGTSQPGHGATPVIVIDGSVASASTDGNPADAPSVNGLKNEGGSNGGFLGLRVENFSNDGLVFAATSGGFIGGLTPGSGNVIVNCGNGSSGSGIELYQTTGTVIQGNDIGTDATGAAALGNSVGILLDNQSSATIGGTATGARNVISGNTSADISISFSDNSTIQGNYIGVKPNGTQSLSGAIGIDIFASANLLIGGTSAAARNVIGGHSSRGIRIGGFNDQNDNYYFSQFDTIEGNAIGVGADGSTPLPNNTGIELQAVTYSNVIGGSLASEGNVIANSSNQGILFDDFSDPNTLDAIRLNSIYGNNRLGIDLNGDGVTPNDSGDGDYGPEDLQNFPLLASASVSGSITTVQGSINSNPGTSLVIDFYSTPTLGPGNSAQGQTYLGSASVNTDSSGNANFRAKLNSAVPAGQYITATATTTSSAPYGDTSEFSAPIQAPAATPVPDTNAPAASLSSAPSVTTATTSPYNFSVTYTDNVAVKASTIDNFDLVVTGPSGYSQTATLTSTGLSDGPIIVATYSVPAPVGGFTSSSDGSYVVTLQPNQIADTSGNFASSAALGNFTVNIPTPPPPVGVLFGSANTAASGYNLTTLGTNDWAKYGVNGSLNGFDHKATGGSQISNVTIVGSGSYGGYNDPARNVSWTDGSPQVSNPDDHGFIYANNKLGAGYSFTAPADTTTRTLYVYLGGYSSGATFTAHLSDGSSPDYTATFSSAGKFNEIVVISYKAASAGQKLTLTYVKTQTINNAGGSIDLMAAALTGAAVVDTVAPTATLTSSNNVNSASSSPYTFAITYNDNVAVKASTIGHNDVLVTGPNGYSQIATLTSTGLQDGSVIVATYSVPAPAGGFTFASNGTYTITVQPNQVSDTSGNFVAGGALGTFSVNVPAPAPAPTGGTLTGTSVAASTSYNLTTLGTADWAHWGRNGGFPGFDHKATGGSQISNVTVVGPNPNVGGYNDPNRNVSWTDGSPTVSDTNDHGFIYNNGAFGSGFSFTVAAGTAAKTLFLYAGGFASGGTLTAHLSDGSAADFVATPSGSGKYNNLYTIKFSAASAGQTLTVTYIRTQQFSAGGSIDLMGAALSNSTSFT